MEREFKEDWLILFLLFLLSWTCKWRKQFENSFLFLLCFITLYFFLIFRLCCFNLYFIFCYFCFFIINYFL